MINHSETGSGLPSYVMAQSGRRLSILAIIYAAASFIAIYVIPKPQEWIDSGDVRVWYAWGGLFVALSLLVVAALRLGSINQSYLVPVGFAYEILGTVGIEFGVLLWNGDPELIELGLSWTSVWIISFAVLLPSTPAKTALAALACASIRPLFLGIQATRGIVISDAAVFLQFVIPTYMCAGIAVVAAKVVYGLGIDVKRAQRLGSYRLTVKLGMGGMGEVWKASHRLLARPAAIKLVRSDVLHKNGRSLLKRFQREVQATANLRSPHTVDIYDYGISADGTFYYVMELLDGMDLQVLVERYGPQPAGRVIHILRQACHSLAEAHEQGLVHRDVKPANIFVCRSGRDLDVVKVLDFGLVKGEFGLASGEAKLTQAGAFYGTPGYASPEMCRGEWDRLDGRSDVYSLGCVAYWLLTGRDVFEADHPMGLLHKHNVEAPRGPSEFATHDVAAGLDRLVLSCLAKAMDDRPSADDLAAELEHLQADDPWTRASAHGWWAQTQVTQQGSAPIPHSAGRDLSVFG